MKFLEQLLAVAILTFNYAGWAGEIPDCSRLASTRPYPDLPEKALAYCSGIEHIVIIMQENHSFDNYLGRLTEHGYAGQVDGVTPEMFTLDKAGVPVHAHHESKLSTADPEHSWKAMHSMWNKGKNDGFAKVNGAVSMGYYEKDELPFYYALANAFSIGDRYFSSVLGPTFPNRFFLYAGTAFGHTKNRIPTPFVEYHQRTIFDLLNEAEISWKYYSDGIGYLTLFQPLYLKSLNHLGRISDFDSEATSGQLPMISFVESNFKQREDEHPPANIQIGQRWVSQRVKSLLQGESWRTSALFLVYDEAGGYFDHVAPPLACLPDTIAPTGESYSLGTGYDRLGFRVPLFAVSPFVKRHYVSHATFDHSSVLKFIEKRFNLRALTRRDANADGFTDLFDCSNPNYSVPELPF